MKIEIVQGDITQQADVDAIVNAANTDLALGAGVAGAIRRRGGDEIDREGRAQGPIRLGQAAVTAAGRLPNKYVIHAAAMGYRPEDARVPKRAGSLSSAAIIADATRNSLLRAEELKLESIALPALATGVAAFPVDECAQAMIATVQEYAREHPQSTVKRVRFVLFAIADYRMFQSAVDAGPTRPSPPGSPLRSSPE
ncbi:MAG TPA: macro domain-containing protein [Terriglobales bacterium]|jgi:O-acetyl-ADP-ribose deacetylase (regulator of RNase III)